MKWPWTGQTRAKKKRGVSRPDLLRKCEYMIFFPSNHLVFQRWLFLVSKWRVMSAGKHNSVTRSIFGWFAFVTGFEWGQTPDSIFFHFDGVCAEMRIAQNFIEDPILLFILICLSDVFVQVNFHFLFKRKISSVQICWFCYMET